MCRDHLARTPYLFYLVLYLFTFYVMESFLVHIVPNSCSSSKTVVNCMDGHDGEGWLNLNGGYSCGNTVDTSAFCCMAQSYLRFCISSTREVS